MNTTKFPELAGVCRLGPAGFLKPFRSLALAALGLSLGVLSARADYVIVDSTKNWVGYMNVYELPENGAAWKFGSPWAPADLSAVFSGTTLTLAPNTSIDRDNPADPYWWAGGAGGAPNKNMDASMYVQDDTLAGQAVTFTGTCITNTLVAPYSCVAFIKEFAADYSPVNSTTVPVSSGTPFIVSAFTTAGNHVQYGFETVGPDARLTNVANLGLVQFLAPAKTNVFVNPSSPWQGYMNVSELPENGGAGLWGSGWGTADLDALFSGGVLMLTPNDSIYRNNPQTDTYWWKPDGTGNKTMDANFYVEDNGLAGKIVSFSGNVWTNNLVAPYTSVAFIKEFTPGYAPVGSSTVPLVSGTPFTLSLATSPGNHVQYGFETVGPNANTALTPLASLGQVLVSSNAMPSGPVITSLPASTSVIVGSNVSLTVMANGTGLTYQWKKNGVNLSNGAGVSGATSDTLALTTVTGAAEANYTVVVTDSAHRTVSGNSFIVVFDPNKLSFDPHAALNGYINVFNNDGGTLGGYVTGFGYDTSLLRAGVVNGVAVMQPNISLYNSDPNNFYTNPDGTPNKFLEQDYFIANDALAGMPLTFTGYCLSNSLHASYTATAWIEDFASDYSSFTYAITNLVAGQPFSITLPTTAGTHIQYGLRVVGLDNAPTNVLTQGAVVVSVIPPSITATRAGGVTQLSFGTVSGHNYTVQYKDNLTDSAWQNGSTVGGTGSTVTVPDTTAVAHRFYRLTIQ